MKQFLFAIAAVTTSAILLLKLFDELTKEKETKEQKT